MMFAIVYCTHLVRNWAYPNTMLMRYISSAMQRGAISYKYLNTCILCYTLYNTLLHSHLHANSEITTLWKSHQPEI